MKFIFKIEQSLRKKFFLCNLFIEIDGLHIGDPEAWAHAGLVSSAISNMLGLIVTQEPEAGLIDYTRNHSIDATFSLMKNWQSDELSEKQKTALNQTHQKIDLFIAIPLAVELFDGEYAYIIKIDNENSKFIWRDFSSKEIQSKTISHKKYINDWEEIERKIKSKNS